MKRSYKVIIPFNVFILPRKPVIQSSINKTINTFINNTEINTQHNSSNCTEIYMKIALAYEYSIGVL